MKLENLLEERGQIEALKIANIPNLKYLAALREFATKIDDIADVLTINGLSSIYIEALLELGECKKSLTLLEEALTQSHRDPIVLTSVVKHISYTQDIVFAKRTYKFVRDQVKALELNVTELLNYTETLKQIDMEQSICFINAYIEASKTNNVKLRFQLATLFTEYGKPDEALRIIESVAPRIGIPRDLCALLFKLKDYLTFDDLGRVILFFEKKNFFKELLIQLAIKKHQAKDIDYVLSLYKFITQRDLPMDCRLLCAQFNLIKDFDFHLGQSLARLIREKYPVKQIKSVKFLDVNLVFHDAPVSSTRKNSFYNYLCMEIDWIFLHEQWGLPNRVNVRGLIDNKFNTFLLADIWGIKRPEIYEYGKCYIDLRLRDSVVIKPVAGAVSKGIFIVYEQNRIHDLYGNKWLGSTNELNLTIEEYLRKGVVRRDAWFLEELISNDTIATKKARDIKFYCFYGKCVVALESQRDDEVLRCWYDRTGNIIDTGKYSDSAFRGNGIDRSHFEMAESISRKLPLPFVRVDFLQSNDQTYLGELTPIPSDSDKLNTYCDSLLGNAFCFANVDLREDLMFNREKFHDFFQLTKYVKR